MRTWTGVPCARTRDAKSRTPKKGESRQLSHHSRHLAGVTGGANAVQDQGLDVHRVLHLSVDSADLTKLEDLKLQILEMCYKFVVRDLFSEW